MTRTSRALILSVALALGSAAGSIESAAAVPLGAAQRSRPSQAEPERPRLDVESYTVEVAINAEERSMKGLAEIQFRQLDRSAYAAFDLDPRLRVSSVIIDGMRAAFRQFDQSATVEIEMNGRPAGTPMTASILYEGRLDPEDRDPRENDPELIQIGKDSAFLLYEGKWFPSNGLFTDKATMTLHVGMPAGWTAISDLPSAGQGFASLTPSYWGMLVAGRYKSDELKARRVNVTVQTLKADSTTARSIQVAAGRILDFYAEAFGPPLSPNLQIVEVDGGDWSSQWSTGALVIPASKFRKEFDEATLARTLARQWFPLKITPQTSADSWLVDGMAVFASLMYFEKTLSPAEFQSHADKALVKALAYEGKMTTRQAGASGRDSFEYQTLVEYRGAYILRMLRWVMGEAKFADLLNRYMDAYRETPVSTESFTKLASSVAGENLDYFFEQWLNSWGAPEFETEYTVFRTSTGYTVRGTVKQNLDLFRMPVELEIVTDGEPEFQRVELAGPSSEFTVQTIRKPREIQVDPAKRILRSSGDIRVQVAINRGEEFAAEDRIDEAIGEYQRAIDQNPRSTLALFRLGEALFEEGNLQVAAQQFRDALNGDLKPKWVEVWCHINLGKIYDVRGFRDRAISAYQQAVNTGDDFYGAQAEARQYLAEPFRGAASAVRN